MLSYIIPAFNEEANIVPLYQRIVKSVNETEDIEILFVDNGSHDKTSELVKILCDKDSRVKLISLSRNFQYKGSLAAGLNHAEGDWVAVLDGDQQDPPELIPQMLELAKNSSSDIVYGRRTERDETLLRKIIFWMFYRIWKFTSDIEVPLDSGEFSLMNRKVVDNINALPERQRFNRGLRAWVGFKQTPFFYKRDNRAVGKSKFNFGAGLNLALDGIISFTRKPLRLISILALIILIACLILIILNIASIVISYFTSYDLAFALPPGLTQTNVLIVLTLGINMLFLGVIGEYVGRIYEEVKLRPNYIIKEIYKKTKL